MHLAPMSTAACSRHDGFAVHFPRLAEDAGEGEAAEGISAAIVAGDERCVESTHQNVIPERGGVAQCGVSGGERGGGPGERECVRAVNPVGFDHVAALIHIEAVGGVGGIARRVEHAGGGEGVAGAPAHHLAASSEVEVAGGEAGVCFLYAHFGWCRCMWWRGR